MSRDRARDIRRRRLWKHQQQRGAQKGRIADLSYPVDGQDRADDEADTTGNRGGEDLDSLLQSMRERLEERP
jgi:hypothetical protein